MYFEKTKGKQEAIQTDILKKHAKSAQLPHELADAAHAHAARFFEEVGRKLKTDCKAGCAYCCHQPATVFPFEAIRIAQILKDSLSDEQLETLLQKMKARIRGLKGTSIQKNINNKTACPLLVNNQCSVYDSRPLTCRLAHSFSVKKCQLSFEKDRFKVGIPVSMELQTGISGIIEGVYEQLPENGLDANLYELCSAVLVALSDSSAAATWASGNREVFKECIKDDT